MSSIERCAVYSSEPCIAHESVFITCVYECTWQMNIMLLFRWCNSTQYNWDRIGCFSFCFRIRRHHICTCTRNAMFTSHGTAANSGQVKTKKKKQNRESEWLHCANRESIVNTIRHRFFTFSFRFWFREVRMRTHAHLLCPVCWFDVIIYLFRRCRKSTNINNYLLISTHIACLPCMRWSWNVHNGKINASNNFGILKNDMATKCGRNRARTYTRMVINPFSMREHRRQQFKFCFQKPKQKTKWTTKNPRDRFECQQ